MLKEPLSLPQSQVWHAHRFRDTFAVGLLQGGVPMDRASALLGHSSIKVTEKRYAPWVRARQEQLEADVRRTWECPPSKSQEARVSVSKAFQRSRPEAPLPFVSWRCGRRRGAVIWISSLLRLVRNKQNSHHCVECTVLCFCPASAHKSPGRFRPEAKRSPRWNQATQRVYSGTGRRG